MNQPYPKIPERFRTSPLLRGISIATFAIWVLITLCVLLMSAWTPVAAQAASPINLGTYISLVFFDSFFGIMALYYHHRAIILDADGVIVRSVFSLRQYPWSDVLAIGTDPGFLPGYHIQTRRSAFGLLKLEFPEHQRIATLIAKNCRKAEAVALAVKEFAPSTDDSPSEKDKGANTVGSIHRPRDRRTDRRKTRHTHS